MLFETMLEVCVVSPRNQNLIQNVMWVGRAHTAAPTSNRPTVAKICWVSQEALQSDVVQATGAVLLFVVFC
jgi:hypothetical protein